MSEDPKITPIHFLPKFCSQCGGKLLKAFVEQENCERLQCQGCRFIAYLNPQPVAGAIPVQDGKVLLLRRGIEPRKSFWTYPAGFVELGETTQEAAVRETKEEVGVDIAVGATVGVYSYADAGVVTVVYLAQVVGGKPSISKEAEEIASFTSETIPWDQLAFRSTKEALEDWIRGRRPGTGG